MVPRSDDAYPSGAAFDGYVSGEHRSCAGRGARPERPRRPPRGTERYRGSNL